MADTSRFGSVLVSNNSPVSDVPQAGLKQRFVLCCITSQHVQCTSGVAYQDTCRMEMQNGEVHTSLLTAKTCGSTFILSSLQFTVPTMSFFWENMGHILNKNEFSTFLWYTKPNFIFNPHICVYFKKYGKGFSLVSHLSWTLRDFTMYILHIFNW